MPDGTTRGDPSSVEFTEVNLHIHVEEQYDSRNRFDWRYTSVSVHIVTGLCPSDKMLCLVFSNARKCLIFTALYSAGVDPKIWSLWCAATGVAGQWRRPWDLWHSSRVDLGGPYGAPTVGPHMCRTYLLYVATLLLNSYVCYVMCLHPENTQQSQQDS